MKYLTIIEKWRIPVYDDPNQIMNGLVEINTEKCSGCGWCTKVCSHKALLLVDGKSQMRIDVMNECHGCGCCVAICPEEAIKQVRGYKFTGFYKTIERGELMPPRL